MSVFVAVPVKDLVNAKQRLLPVLTAEERQVLARAMLEDVLAALEGALPGSVRVVTRDAAVMEVTRRYGAGCLREPENRGHTQAVALAQETARAEGVTHFVTIPGDVPCVTAAEVRQLVDALPSGPGVAFVPSLSGFGTNGACLSPPDVMPLKFGEPSFDNHLVAARARGLSPQVLRLAGLGLDIDAPEDLRLLLGQGAGTRSGRLLAAWRIGERLVAR